MPKFDREPVAAVDWSSWIAVTRPVPRPITPDDDADSPGMKKPNVPPNFSTNVRVETTSCAGPVGWTRIPAADGSWSPNRVFRTSRFSSVWPGPSVITAGGAGVPVRSLGMSESANVTGLPPTFVTYRLVLKNVSLFPRAYEAWVTMTSVEEGTGFPA